MQTLQQRITANQATLWNLWRQGRVNSTSAPAFITAQKQAYQEHQALLTEVRALRATRPARAAVKNIRKFRSIHKDLAA